MLSIAYTYIHTEKFIERYSREIESEAVANCLNIKLDTRNELHANQTGANSGKMLHNNVNC